MTLETETTPHRVLVFGPQALSFDAAAFNSIWSTVTEEGSNKWILNTINELPSLWEEVVARFPKYKTARGDQRLAEFLQWFRTGRFGHGDSEEKYLPNILLSPLVIISHLCEYSKYQSEKGPQQLLDERQNTEILGFCTGFLTALAVSVSSRDSQGANSIEAQGATAIRLAMLVGGVVDAQNVLNENGPARAFATAWASSEAGDEMSQVLKRFPEAYVSVSFDERRVTVTTAQSTVAGLQQALRGAGIIANEIGLYGRFHSQSSYGDDIEQLIDFCESHTALCLPDASALLLPTRSNSSSEFITSGALHGHALRTILIEHSNWYATVKRALVYDNDANRSRAGRQQRPIIRIFGPEACIPPSIARLIEETKLEESADYIFEQQDILNTVKTAAERYAACAEAQQDDNKPRARKDDDIAVVGMSIKVAGADDVTELWDLLCAAESQHREVPADRVPFLPTKDGDGNDRKWFANLINDHDAFDQKFFKKSAREAASTDPQQRQMLQVAYQALEQAGYFSTPSHNSPNKNVGCYIGVCAADYEDNVGGYKPNAFTATGNLKSFIAGKISHYFGWTGPGLCIDTACSSSLVAIHMACKAILSGECEAALAGGVNVLSSPRWFSNLAAASFLSPTGQCKPFDTSADGYCRGEGIAAVYLKRMSAAIADGDQVLGTIASSAVFQNQNCTPIFVPNAPSLSGLFGRVLDQSKLEASEISVVEAHGTGTQVGDPAEYDSIRQALSGASTNRSEPLMLGSVKGLVGHTECTSGAVSLIKTLLMIQQRGIPAQPSFDTLNPNLNASAADTISIPTTFQNWDNDFRAALINNYGASGSNASMIVTQAPLALPSKNKGSLLPTTTDVPFRICGKDMRALTEYSEKLRKRLVRLLKQDPAGFPSVADLAFNINRQSNPTLDQAVVFSSRSSDQLVKSLGAFSNGELDAGPTVVRLSPARPVILCFGGQISTYVGLSRDVYNNVAVFRGHLEEVDAVCRSLGHESIFPTIFDRSPIADPVKLQTCLFAAQHACAKSWIDCGVAPVSVVGHSFGELTSMCISGVLSLSDAVKMIAGRASIIRDAWGPEKGSMLAVEADLPGVERLLGDAALVCQDEGETPPTIACVNGPRSFTLGGSSKAIDITTEVITKAPASSGMRFKRLSITNAYHSTLVQPMMPQLEEVGKSLTFGKPTIHMERASELPLSAENITAKYVAEHMRNPVFFHQAVSRLAKKHPSAVWLEAGSNSTITNMASRALNTSTTTETAQKTHFQPINITTDNGLQLLVNATTSLWKEGLPITFWAHHQSQTHEYTPLMLPSYQFEKPRHWMPLVKPSQTDGGEDKTDVKTEEEKPKGLWSFKQYLGDVDKDGFLSARFRVNTMTDKYLGLVSGHVVANTAPICPATLQTEITVNAIASLVPDLTVSKFQPRLSAVENLASIVVDPSRSVWLDVRSTSSASTTHLNWEWKVVSEGAKGQMVHSNGNLSFVPNDDVRGQSEFSGYERLVGYQRCKALLSCDDADDVIKGRNIYKAFGSVVDYAEKYRGLQKLVGKGTESAGRVVVEKRVDETFTWLDTITSDCFSQVGGIWANCMTDTDLGDMFIATGFEKWIRSPHVGADKNCPPVEAWDVFASNHWESDQLIITDIFIFNPTNGKLVEAILGVKYHKIAKASMSRILMRLTGSAVTSKVSSASEQPVHAASPKSSVIFAQPAAAPQSHNEPTSAESKKQSGASASQDVVTKTRALLADISGLESEAVLPDSQLADIGIDSLMAMELTRELDTLFSCHLPNDDLMMVTDFAGLVRLIQDTLGLEEDGDDGGTSSPADSVQSSASSNNHLASSTEGSTILTSISSDDEKSSNVKPAHSLGNTHVNGHELSLSASSIIKAFEESKKLTDQFIVDYRCGGYMEQVLPRQTQLCVALAVEAFEQLGCPLGQAMAGQKLKRIQHLPEHQRLVDYIYKMLEHEARLIDTDGDGAIITRTAVLAPSKSSEDILAGLLRDFPDHEWASRLTFYAASKLADVLTGKCDGIKLIFGTDQGRELVTGLYGDSLLNKLANVQMQDILAKLALKIPRDQGPLKILELGAGTGGTTRGMAALLVKLNIPVEYTFTDLSGSFVAAARRSFNEYPFMKFRVHDIEKEPAQDLIGTQHVIIASNAIHATHNLQESVSNVRKALRPDGFLMMLEMTEPVYWVDLIFGLFEGWWLFNDDRRHAIAHQSVWERELHSAGYGHVDWSDGNIPEVHIQRIIVALASGPQYDRHLPRPQPVVKRESAASSSAARRAAVDGYVQRYTQEFAIPPHPTSAGTSTTVATPGQQTVLITGASGSLGTHLAAHIAALPHVNSVICLNRRAGPSNAEERQQKAMEERGILLDAACQSKLQVLQADSKRPLLGLDRAEYDNLVRSVTHIIHNAWPMSGKRPLSAMEPQFRVMRNLIDLARDISCAHPEGFQATFQLVSSIAVVGRYVPTTTTITTTAPPHPTTAIVVPEDRVTVDAVLDNGYGEAKYVCERMLDQTLGSHRERFRAMAVRLGQVAGSRVSGYWNPAEHLAFLLKSSQTLRSLPRLGGDLCWTPLEDVAGALADLALRSVGAPPPHPVYHIDNPVRQRWADMLPVLADALGIPRRNMVPFGEWVRRVRSFPGSVERDNPAAMLVDFLDDNFVHMSCGGMLLDTAKACEHSPTLAAVGPVTTDVAVKYVRSWQAMGFLHG